MKRPRKTARITLQWLSLAASLLLQPAWADEYSDVSQLVRAAKYPEALAKVDQFLGAQPKDPQMRFMRGVILRETGKTADALNVFIRLTEDYPELPEPYNNLAVLYANQGQYDKARNALEQAIRTNPSYTTAHENLGDVYAKLASEAYNKALQLDGGSGAAVAPKLAVIKEIFIGNNRVQKLAVAAAPAAVAPAAPTPAAVAPPATKPAAPVTAAPANTPAASAPAASAKPATTPAAATPPVAAAPAAKPAEPAASNATNKEVEAAVRAWATAWASKDVKGYLASYGKEFDPPGNMGRSAWEEERRQRIAGKASISVKIDNLQVSVNGTRATARFRQDYKAGGLAVSSRKTLELQKTGERWKIVKESVGG